MFFSDEGPMLEMLDFIIYIGITPTFLYFDLYLNTAYAAHYAFISHYVYSFGWNKPRSQMFLKY